jgi:flagellar biosynthetic protein FlhB
LSMFCRRCRRDELSFGKIDLQLFAEEEKTEPATPHRRQEARRKGQVFHSTEFSAAVSLLAAGSATLWLIPWWQQELIALTNTVYRLAPVNFDISFSTLIGTAVLSTLLRLLAPLFLVVVTVGLVTNLVQVGFLFSTEPLSLRLNRLNPVAGFQRIFSRRSLANLIRNVIKLCLVAAVAYRSLQSEHYLIPRLPLVSVTGFVSILGSLSRRLLWQCGAAIFLLAVADYAYQRWEYEKSLSMSIQEIKEEFRQTEGSPEVRAEIRERQRKMVHARMMDAVPKADVVITNPTHYAIALKYDSAAMAAPEVVAKGAGLIAQRIMTIAREHAVMVVENKPLARSLYQAVEIGEGIPAEFYQAVAEILAYVYGQQGLI